MALQPRPGGPAVVDSLDFRDADGKPFSEPTAELSFLAGTKHVSAALAPSGQPDRFRWHIATEDLAGSIAIVSLDADTEGGFDLRDHGDTPSVRLRRLRFAGARPVATLQFPIRADGTLAEMDASSQRLDHWRGDVREIDLPPQLLDNVRAVVAEPTGGTVAGLRRNEDGGVDVIATMSDDETTSSDIDAADIVELGLSGMRSLDGSYEVRRRRVGTLARTLGDGTTRATAFESADTFASGGGALYDERVDCRLLDEKGSPVAIQDGWISFHYWCKRSQLATERERFDASGDTRSEPLEDGWTRLHSRYRVPETLTLVRGFGITVDGDWHRLELRAHRLDTVSSTTTLLDTDDVLDPIPIGMDHPHGLAARRAGTPVQLPSESIALRHGLGL